jgi:predicted AlkP superfamily pyrophosphatase or phosphodiesterase
MLKSLKALCLPLLLASSLVHAADAPGAKAAGPTITRPVPEIQHAIIISCDGLRPDVMLRADTPNLRKLMKAGSFTFWARTVPESITLPSHTSMLTGVNPQRHGVSWNGDLPADKKRYPNVPTIFEIAKHGGLTTAAVTSKSKFDVLARPEATDWSAVKAETDEKAGDNAVKILREHKPDVMFIHFSGADSKGHSLGWGTPQQIQAIEAIDAQIGRVLETLDETDSRKSTVIVVSSDHGGAGRGHGRDDPRSRHIPWIIAGPDIRPNYDLTRNAGLVVRTEDTFATICWLMGLPLDPELDGKPVYDALVVKEMLHDVP